MRVGRATTGSIRGAIAALVFACAMLMVPSLASAGWSAPVTVSGAGSSVSQTRVAGGSDGTSWVVWKRSVGGFDVIQGTKVTVDGTHGPIATISAPTMNATDPVIEARADGSAMVAWLNLSALDDTVHSRAIAANGTLGPIATRSAVGPAGQPAADIAIALGADGTAGIAWRKFNGSNWIGQAVKVAADGTSGTIHDLSANTVSVGPPAIGAEPPVTAGSPVPYRIFWPQGAGPTSNVGSRQIESDGTLTDLYLAFTQGGGDPFDVGVAYGADGAMNAVWIRTRETVDPESGTTFTDQAVEWLRAAQGTTLNPAAPAPVQAVTPTIISQPYDVASLEFSETFGGQPVAAWVHDLNGGGQRVETARITPNLVGATFDGWANPSGIIAAAVEPTIAANASAVGVGGWTAPGLLPGQSKVSWTRFSNSSFLPFTPTGDFIYSADPGFVVADNAKSLAAFTGIDGANVGTARVTTFADPSIRVDPGQVNYGRTDIGLPSTQFVSIRSSGETPVDVSDIAISGPDSARYQLNGASECLKEFAVGANCRFGVVFTPGSTAVQTATVTVSSSGGAQAVTLTGSGLNRTRNRITLNKRRFAVRGGKVIRIRATARNRGGVTSNNTRVCVNLRKRALKLAGKRCRSLGALPAGASRTLKYRIRVTWRAQRGAKLPVTFVMRANNAVVRQAVAHVRRKGR